VTLVVLCALRIEALALRSLRPRRTGMGRERAQAWAAGNRPSQRPGHVVVVTGFCGAVDRSLAPGDVVVAHRIRSEDGELAVPESPRLEAALCGAGLRVVTGGIHSADRILRPHERRTLAGVAAVDMESYWLGEGVADRLGAVVRVVVDQADRRLLDPRTIPAGIRAYRSLGKVARALRAWAGSGDTEQLRY
jgi:hypothetical protein